MSAVIGVVLVAGPLEVTGANVAALDLATALSRRGHRISVVAGEGPLLSRFEEEGIDVAALGLSGGFLSDLPRTRELLAAISSRSPDLIHVADPRMRRLGTLLARLSRRPWVLSLNGTAGGPVTRSGARLRAILVSGRAAHDEVVLRRAAPRSLVRVVRPGVDLSRFPEPASPFGESRPIVGALVRHEPGSGLDDLVRAHRLVIRSGHEPHLVIAGHGPEEMRLRGLTRDLGLREHVTFTALPGGFERLLATFDVFVLPSVTEWSGTEALQAMAAARPVVASGAGIIFSIVRDGETGLLAPHRDPRALADRIAKILEDPARATEMGRAGRSILERGFPIEGTVRDVERVYREALVEEGRP
jgi:glycosyltransferase involved in cell wall biosynthesis